jgi:hypothetical protein
LLGEETVVQATPIIPKPPPGARGESSGAANALANPVLQGVLGVAGLIFGLVQTAMAA